MLQASASLPGSKGSQHVVMTVSRCGNNYRLNGVDYANNAFYEGFFYQPEIVELIKSANIGATSRTAIKLWHYENIARVLLSNVSAISKIPSATHDLGKMRENKRCSNFSLVLRRGGSTSMKSLVSPPLRGPERQVKETLESGLYSLIEQANLKFN